MATSKRLRGLREVDTGSNHKRPCCSEGQEGGEAIFRVPPYSSAPSNFEVSAPAFTSPPSAGSTLCSGATGCGLLEKGGSPCRRGSVRGGGTGGEPQEFVAWVLKCLDSDEEEDGAKVGVGFGGEPLTLEKVLADGRHGSSDISEAIVCQEGDGTVHSSGAAASISAHAVVPELEGPQTPHSSDGCHGATSYWPSATPLLFYSSLPDLVGAIEAPDPDPVPVGDIADITLQFLLESSEEESMCLSGSSAGIGTPSSSPQESVFRPVTPYHSDGNGRRNSPIETCNEAADESATWRLEAEGVSMSGLPGIDPLTEELARLVEQAEEKDSSPAVEVVSNGELHPEEWDYFEEYSSLEQHSPLVSHHA